MFSMASNRPKDLPGGSDSDVDDSRTLAVHGTGALFDHHG